MDLLKGKVGPLYFRLLVASLGGAMIASVFGLIDAMMVGRYHGPLGTAALAVFSPTWSFVYSLGILSGIGGSVLFANLRGKGDRQTSNEYFTAAVIFGVALSLLATLVLAIWNEPLFRMFGADDQILPMAQQYLTPICFGIPCCVFSNLQSAFLRNDGGANLAMKAVIISGLFNVVGDYVFIFLLDLGIFGAGLATVISLYISNLIMLSHYFSRNNTLRLVKLSSPLTKIGRIVTTGFSTAISDFSLGIIIVLFNRQIMDYLGTDALSVYGIITQVVAFVQCCAYGTGQAAQPIISQNHGGRKPDRIRQCLRYSLYTSAAFGLLWTTLAELAPNLFVHLFMKPTPAVLEIAPKIIRLYCTSFLLLPFNIFAAYYFQAIMKPGASLAASLARGILVSGAAILILPAAVGPDGLWLAMLVTDVIVFAFSLWLMVRYTRQLLKENLS